MKPPPLALRSSDLEASGIGSRELRRLAQQKIMVKVRSGAYVNATTWAELDVREQYVARIHATVEQLSSPVAISHWSAAAVWGFPVPSKWPQHVEVTDPRRTTSNKIPSLHRRPGELRPGDFVEWEGVPVTTPARTAADLALASPFDEAVMLFDHGLRVGAFSHAEILAHLDRRPDARRRSSARASLDFASPKAEWPGESFSRVAMSTHGLEAPVLQQPFDDRQGRIGRVDFFWESVGIVGEFDGDWKYTDPRFMRGRTVAQVVRDEKRRQGRLEAHPRVSRVLRWDYPVARTPDELARQLFAGGVPRADRRRVP